MRFATLIAPNRQAHFVRLREGMAVPIARAYERPGVDPLRVMLSEGRNPARVKPIARPFRIERAAYRPPVTAPSKMIGIMGNYWPHADEASFVPPKEPSSFAEYPNALLGHGQAIRYRRKDSRNVDFEGELALVIGRRARDVKLARALDYVFGYTIANDISARDNIFREGQLSRGKSFDTFAPLGPVLVTAEEIPDPQALRIQTRVNGRVLQDDVTGSMIFSCADFLSYLSRFMTLEPGDVLWTGTPGGVGFFRKPKILLTHGAKVEVEIEKIGVLRNRVRVDR